MIEISYLCDACGRDCTHHHYVLSLTRRVGGETYRLEVGGNEPILCPECILHVQQYLSTLSAEWEKDHEYDGF